MWEYKNPANKEAEREALAGAGCSGGMQHTPGSRCGCRSSCLPSPGSVLQGRSGTPWEPVSFLCTPGESWTHCRWAEQHPAAHPAWAAQNSNSDLLMWSYFTQGHVHKVPVRVNYGGKVWPWVNASRLGIHFCLETPNAIFAFKSNFQKEVESSASPNLGASLQEELYLHFSCSQNVSELK